MANPTEIPIRPATAADLDALSSIARRARAHWGYPAEWLAEWRPRRALDVRRSELP